MHIAATKQSYHLSAITAKILSVLITGCQKSTGVSSCHKLEQNALGKREWSENKKADFSKKYFVDGKTSTLVCLVLVLKVLPDRTMPPQVQTRQAL